MSWRVGIDTGGTFTDLAAVEVETGRVEVAKVPSTPANPADAIMAALQLFRARAGEGTAAAPEARGGRLDGVGFLAHGTTVATNALLEGSGSTVGLLVTRGFRGLYGLRAGSRPQGPDLIDPRYQKPPTLVDLFRTAEVSERTAADGAEVEPLDEAQARAALRTLRERGCESLAVCLLFSFLDARHEERVAELAAEELPGCRVSLSSRVLPVIREYPRLSTTVLDAYVGPVVARYLVDLGRRAQRLGVRGERLYIMQSNGGLMRLDVAAAHPNGTLVSGPAAGVVFAAELGRRTGLSDLVSFDMGGTSTDISVLRGLRYSQTQEGRIGGQDVGTRMIEIRTLGAGGGTVAFVGPDGLLKVGPRSAGAVPGPACYDRGGTQPTVTDANLALGLIGPEGFLGVPAARARDLAMAALGRLGATFGLSALDVARGIRRIVGVRMAVGLRAALAEKGCDPRRFTLVAFGGSGPLHAGELARQVGLRRVLVPRFPGLACSLGLLQTDVVHTHVQGMPRRLGALEPAALEAAMGALRARALEETGREGFAPEAVVLTPGADLRYARQGYQLPVGLRGGGPDALREAFHAAHREMYGVEARDSEVEVVSLWCTATCAVPRPETPVASDAPPANGEPPAPAGWRAVFLDPDREQTAPVHRRAELRAGQRLSGPAVIEQEDATVWIGVGEQAAVDAGGNLLIDVPASEVPEGGGSHGSGLA